VPTPTLQELADHLAGRLQRSVTVVDPEIRILCASAHFGDEDDARVRAILQRVALPEVYRHIHSHGVRQWAAAGWVPAAWELGFKRRLVIPIRRGATLLALLMITDGSGDELGQGGVEAATQAAHLMGDVLDREQLDGEQRRARRAELLTALLSDHDATREAALQQASGDPVAPLDHVVVLTMMVWHARPSDPDRLSLVVEAGLQNTELREGQRLAHVFDGRVATISSASDDRPTAAQVDELGRRVLRAVDPLLGDAATAAIGLPAVPARPRHARRPTAVAPRRGSRTAAPALPAGCGLP
jgi:hypothetical protein